MFFHVPVGHCIFINAYANLLPIFNWIFMLICMSFLYNLDNPSSHTICKYFLSFSRVSVLSIVFFGVEKLVSLTRSYLFIFAFISFALGDRSNKTLL